MEKLKPHVKYKSWILVGVFALLIFLDLLFKYLEERFAWNCVIIKGWVEIKGGITNPGCAFSFLDEHPEIGQPILITVTFVLLAVLVFLFIVMKEKYMITKTSIAIIAAGAVGNLVDRLMLGCVRDWFGLNIFGLVYCNFADFFIVIGAILVVIDILFLEEWSVWPLPKKAREGAKRREAEEQAKKAEKEALANGGQAPQMGQNVNISADNSMNPTGGQTGADGAKAQRKDTDSRDTGAPDEK